MAILTVDLKKIAHNASLIVKRARQHDVSVYGVTKVLAGPWQVADVMLKSGVTAIADSRLENISKMRQHGISGPYVLLRLPRISEADKVVALTDISLNSELATLEALSQAALRQGVVHKVILMVDLGDLREGVWPTEFLDLVGEVVRLPGIKIYGIGTNLTCYGGVVPDASNMTQLLDLKEQASAIVGHNLEVSAGNSSTLPLLYENKLPRGVTNLRIGEGIILGRETVNRQQLPGAFIDACTISAEVIELKDKPSVPIGTIGQDAFGNVPQFENLGVRRRAILALGRQDTVPEGLLPLIPNAYILGASSDHLIVDVTDSEHLEVGDTLSFTLTYSALLAASTSEYVTKQYI